MFCPNCGARNSDADSNCQKCGYNLKDSTGAKFKGTMLMMNSAVGAPEARPSSPPQAGAAPTPQGAAPPAATASAAGGLPAGSPDEAARTRARLKGTMIGVAPPGVGVLKPSGSASGAKPSTPPGGQPARPRQPTPGLPPRGGVTMIGTGIGPLGFTPPPSQAAAPQAPPAPVAGGPTAHGHHSPAVAHPSAAGPRATGPVAGPTVPGPTVPGPTVPGPSATASHWAAGGEPTWEASDAMDAPGTVRSEPGLPGTPAGPTVREDQVSAYGGTRVMSQQMPAAAALDPMGGTMVAGTPRPTDPMAHAKPQFAANAGVRTGTPAMGVPAMDSGPETQPLAAVSADDTLAPYVKPESKLALVLLTVFTGGLYLVYRKFKR